MLSVGCSNNAPVVRNTYYGYFSNAKRTKFWKTGGFVKPPVKKWSYKYRDSFGNRCFATSCAPVTANGIAFLPDPSGGLDAIEIKSGKTIWKNKSSHLSNIESPPVYSNGEIFVVSGDTNADGSLLQRLVAINAHNGNIIWESGIIGSSAISYADENPIILNGRVYLGGLDFSEKFDGKPKSSIFVFNEKTGNVEHKITIDPAANMFFDTLATDGKCIYGSLIKGYFNYYLFCYNPAKNKTEWIFDISDPNRRNYRWPRIAISNNIIVTAYLCIPNSQYSPNEITVIKTFDIQKKKILWEKETCCVAQHDEEAFRNDKIRFQYFQTPHFAVKKDKVYFTLGDGKIVCANIRSGKYIFVRNYSEFQNLSRGFFYDKENKVVWFPRTDFYVTNNVLFVTTETNPDANNEGYGTVIMLDADKGNTLWENKIPQKGEAVLSLTPVSSGMLVLLNPNGYSKQPISSILQLWR